MQLLKILAVALHLQTEYSTEAAAGFLPPKSLAQLLAVIVLEQLASIHKQPKSLILLQVFRLE